MKQIKNTKKVRSFFDPHKCKHVEDDLFCTYKDKCKHEKEMFGERVCRVKVKELQNQQTYWAIKTDRY